MGGYGGRAEVKGQKIALQGLLASNPNWYICAFSGEQRPEHPRMIFSNIHILSLTPNPGDGLTKPG